VILPKGDQYLIGTVVGRKHDIHGNPIGKADHNPIFDTHVYNVEFPDGHTEEFAANIIAKCLYSQVDNEGRQYLMLDKIIDYQKSKDAVEDEQKLQVSASGNIVP
jgi:hypothetical protein